MSMKWSRENSDITYLPYQWPLSCFPETTPRTQHANFQHILNQTIDVDYTFSMSLKQEHWRDRYLVEKT